MSKFQMVWFSNVPDHSYSQPFKTGLQWGLEYRTFEYRIHSNTERFHVLNWDGSDFEWSVHSYSYENRTLSTIRNPNMFGIRAPTVISKLEEDAKNVLKFMASNGLVANPSKTTLLILNHKSDEPVSIKIGTDVVKQEVDAKLLGVQISENQKWSKQITRTGGVISALNQRNFLIRRLSNHINKSQLEKVADSIWTSKMRYGLQLYGPVRKLIEDPQNGDMEKL